MTNTNNILPNGNDELLSWAVENITEWNDSYTHLRSDSTAYPFYTDMAHEWYVSNLEWTFMSNKSGVPHWEDTGITFRTPPQVITKQEWLDAKAKLEAGCNDLLVDALGEIPIKTPQEAKQGHIHAELMAEYALVAKTNPEPWKEFEWRSPMWAGNDDWAQCPSNISFDSQYQYRRKPTPPKTMNIGGIVVEACPLKEEPEFHTTYYYATYDEGSDWNVETETWDGCSWENDMLSSGRAFATQQEAQAVADALNSLYKKAVDEAWNSL